MNYTTYGYRLQQLAEGPGYNWLFLPGGPGLGSAYLTEFCKKLKLSGNIFLIDFPKDGTNSHGRLDLNHWQEGLIELVSSMSQVILVAHSFAGMFLLNFPKIESYLSGVVLMNTSTSASFFHHVAAMQEQHQLPDLLPAVSNYHLTPNDDTYKEFWHSYKYYCFTADEMSEGEKMIPLLAFNSDAYYFAIEHFYPFFECRLHPTLPTLTIASGKDFVCQPFSFLQHDDFQRKNIINKLIPEAGHCPWLMHFDEVQECFDEFILDLKQQTI